MKHSIKKRLTMSSLAATMRTSSGAVPLVQLQGSTNEYNHNIEEAFKPLETRYGPVLPCSWRDRQFIAGGGF